MVVGDRDHDRLLGSVGGGDLLDLGARPGRRSRAAAAACRRCAFALVAVQLEVARAPSPAAAPRSGWPRRSRSKAIRQLAESSSRLLLGLGDDRPHGDREPRLGQPLAGDEAAPVDLGDRRAARG